MSSRNKSDVKKLFEYWCEVSGNYDTGHSAITNSLHNGDENGLIPSGIITESFPENFIDEKTIADIPAFAFPCEFHSDSVQSYSFVLTTDDSKWRFGFCRHDPKTYTTMVVITLLPWHDTFLKLLTVLAELRRLNNADFRQFLSEAYNGGVPDLGCQLRLIYGAGRNEFVFERPKQFQLPSIPENHNLNLYYNFVDPKNMIAVFAAMLAERRIIFTSRRLDRLSSCIQAANAFLYPMVWQHIFIPVLPMKLKDYLSAPMPYLIGVPQIVLETMMSEELGEVVILNCDTKTFESPFNDVQSVPSSIVSHLKKQLSQPHQLMGDRVSRIFLGVLVQLIGGYRDAVEFRSTGKTFNSEKFIESRPPHLRSFLAKMMQLQIFQQFIDERLDMMNTGLGFSDEFEQETVRYAEKLKKRGRFYQLKEKTNPAVKSAVKSVKESSRVAKHAYRDLKSKFRDITPIQPQNSYFRSHLNPQYDCVDRNGYLKPPLGTHYSAPSSPVFNKRCGQHVAYSDCPYAEKTEIDNASPYLRREPTSLTLDTSSSQAQANVMLIKPSNSSHQFQSSLATSPTSSPCSSEMNLTQELQDHPLFKIPIVDRSLKPYHSLEPYRISRTTATLSKTTSKQMPARPPLPAAHVLQQCHKLNNTLKTTNTLEYSYSIKHNQLCNKIRDDAQSVTKILSLMENVSPLGKNIPNDLVQPESIRKGLNNNNNNNNNNIKFIYNTPAPTFIQQKSLNVIASNYDRAHDMKCPPVPIRHQPITNHPATFHVKNPVMAVQSTAIKRQSNCRQSPSSSDNNSSLSLSHSSASSTPFVTIASSCFSLQKLPSINTVKMVEKIDKEKESQHLNNGAGNSFGSAAVNSYGEDHVKDLISLEDSNSTSIDLEDFDPLNQNARSIPDLSLSNVDKKSTTLPSAINNRSTCSKSMLYNTNISNPLYMYCNPKQLSRAMAQKPQQQKLLEAEEKPPPLPKSIPPAIPPPNEDFELLRKYGLDQFSLTMTTPNILDTERKASHSQLINVKERSASSTASNSVIITTGKTTTTGMENWTTFD